MKLIACAIGALIPLLVVLSIYMFPYWRTDSLLRHESRLVLNALYRGENHVSNVDAWDVPIINQVHISKESILVQVISSGRDRILGNDDDQYFEKLDINKTYLASRWVGSKLKEAGKGFVEGIKQQSPFKSE